MNNSIMAGTILILGSMIISILILTTQTKKITLEDTIKGHWFVDGDGVGNIVCANFTKPSNSISLSLECPDSKSSIFNAKCNLQNILSLYRVMKSNMKCTCKLEWDLGTSMIKSHPVSVSGLCGKEMVEIELNPNMIPYIGEKLIIGNTPFLELYNPMHNIIKKCFGEDKDEIRVMIKYADKITYSIIIMHSLHMFITLYLMFKMYQSYESTSVILEGIWLIGDLLMISFCIYLIISMNTAIGFTQPGVQRSKRSAGSDCESIRFNMTVYAFPKKGPTNFTVTSSIKEWKNDWSQIADKDAPCNIIIINHPRFDCDDFERMRKIICENKDPELSAVSERTSEKTTSVLTESPKEEITVLTTTTATTDRTSALPIRTATLPDDLDPFKRREESDKDVVNKEVGEWKYKSIKLTDRLNNEIMLGNWWDPVVAVLPWKSVIETIVSVIKQCLGVDSTAHLILIKYAIMFSIIIISYNISEFIYSVYTIWDEFKSLQNPIFILKFVKIVFSIFFVLIGFIFLFIEIQTRNVVETNA